MNKVYSMLGLAKKAGKLLGGSDVCERALKSGKITLLILSGDASEGTKKKFRDMCSYRSIPMRVFGDRNSLGRHTGCSERVVIGLCDRGFTEAILKLIDEA